MLELKSSALRALRCRDSNDELPMAAISENPLEGDTPKTGLGEKG